MNEQWKDESLSFEERARILVSQMTLEEKVSQMTYNASALPRFGIFEYNWWNECLHGVARAGTATVFPQSIGMAAAFDAEKLNKVAETISDEARIKHHAADEMGDHGIYKGLTMWSPNINLLRDPRWGRGHETYGEDPCLTGRLGEAFIKGLQGDDPKYLKCVATAKHYAVHSGPEADRHHFDVHPTKRDMAESYLPAFKAAVQKAGVHSVMGAYNRVNGQPACASTELLQDILRDEWGFKGYVVSDCGAIEDIYKRHKVCPDAVHAAALAVNNGCDLCCGQEFPHLVEAVKQGLISEETITESVYRLMLYRFRLGMFDDPAHVPYAQLPYEENDCEAHHEQSLDMALDTVVMLKNDGILPLDGRKVKTIAVIGPNADSRAALMGNYSGTASVSYTVLEGIRRAFPESRILYAEGSSLVGGSAEAGWGESADFRIAEALKAAQMADVAIVVTGLNGECEGEEGYGSGDRSSMDLPESQRMLLDALCAVETPMVLVNMTGSATLFPHEARFSAILQAWYPGQMGGLAVGQLLSGAHSPCGKLPVTFYKSFDQLPPFEDYHMAGRTYRFMEQKPAYPFGFGLSYTQFAFEDLCLRKAKEGVEVQVTVKNVGERAAKAVAQAYVRILNPEYPAPIHQLGAFGCAFLQPGEQKRMTLRIEPEQLSLFDDEGRAVRHQGTARIFVGDGQPDQRTLELTGREDLWADIEL